ncbi:MAG TPA: uroporphyrinogen-III synthase [Steroidobacteraceae bacterium]|nr:uroporphyrinogen-III synthase [Steroidobacteraceae bacterium]
MSTIAGRRPVVVTRAEGKDGPLSRELRGLGLTVLSWPAVSVSAADPGALRAALAEVQSFGWIVFASRHAVAAVVGQLPAAPPGVRVAAVGQATALTLRQRGWPVDLLPDEANAAALVAAFAARWQAEDAGVRMLYPASSRALPTIAAGLRQLGASVTQVEAYRTDSARLDLAECRNWIARGEIAAVTFASPSAVTELADSLGEQDFQRLLAGAAAVAIGRTTARELRARGHNAVIAEAATLHGLAMTTLRLLQTRD